MKAKSIVTAVLLMFVAASVVALVVKEARRGRSLESMDGLAAADVNVVPLPDDALVAYYFHGNVRCPTCSSIETQAHDAVTERFADELASGRIVWRVVNYESPADAHYVDDYQIVAPIVVLSQRRAGRETAWRSLGRVWELVGDPPAFATYVQQEVNDMQASAYDKET